MSWYKSKIQYSEKQKTYIELIQSSFLVQNEEKEWIPYDMTEYQKDFHSLSMNVLGPDAPDILFFKSRGISFTWSAIIDEIMTAASFDDITIPIIAQNEKASTKIIHTVKRIVQHCKLKEIRDNVRFTTTGVFFTLTGSSIEAYPSSSAADSVRSMRLLRVHMDEYAFQQRATELLAACQETMQGDLGQLIIGSTPNGRQNKYAEMVIQCLEGEDIGFYLFDLPVFDKQLFDKDKLPSEQNLEPIAPWISLKKLDVKWKRDKQIFMQENMTDFLDDSISFISYNSVSQVVDEDLINHKDILRENPIARYETNNDIYIGVDVAEKNDYFAVVAYEEVTDDKTGTTMFVQRYLDYFRGVGLPDLEEYMHNVLRYFPTTKKCRIDSTGVGSSLPQYLRKEWGTKIESINFASTVYINSGKDKDRITKVMATNLKRSIEGKSVVLLQSSMQTKHITALNYLLKAPSNEDGHGDIFWAHSLALLQSKRSIGSTSVYMKSERESAMELNNVEGETPYEKFKRMSVEDRMKFYQQVAKKKKIL
jgi:phage FluMu gp28-like protein